MAEWQDISTAPKDGSPVWVEGDNYGNPENGVHRCWAWWSDEAEQWKSGDPEPSHLLFLTRWLNPSPQPRSDKEGG